MSVHVVLPGVEIGGMEKRLSGLFAHLVKRGDDVRLVASTQLVAKLAASADEDLDASRMDTFVGEEGSGASSIGPLRRCLRRLRERDPDGVYHYGLASPLRLHPGLARRVLYTIPNASLGQYNRRGLVEVYGGVLRARKIDVLDPDVHGQLSRRFFWKAITRTPGSFVDLARYAPAAKKESLVVFLGLLSEEKQAPRLATMLPAILERLRREGVEAQFALLGRDGPGCRVIADVTALHDSSVRAGFEADPRGVLARAKVFLSLQRSTNHPSKSLLEAMASGAAPVVTDTRDSRLSAPEDLATYVPRDFSAGDIAAACLPLLRRTDDEIAAHAEKMRTFLAGSFSIETMADYYRGLYAALAR